MWNSHLNDMEIPEAKRLFPKGLNWVQHRVSRIGLLLLTIENTLLLSNPNSNASPLPPTDPNSELKGKRSFAFGANTKSYLISW